MNGEIKLAIWLIANAAIDMHEDRISDTEFEEYSTNVICRLKNTNPNQ